MPSRFARQFALFVVAAATFAGPAVAVRPETAPPSRDSRPLGPGTVAEPGAGAPRVAPSSGPGTIRTAASLAAVLAVIFGGAALFKRFAGRSQTLAGSLGAAGKSPAGIMEIVGRYPIGRGNTLVLLRLDKRILLLSQTVGASSRGFLRPGAASLNTLCELSSPDDVASILAKASDADGDSMTARFQSLLTGFRSEPDLPPSDNPGEHAADTSDRPAVVVRTGSWAAASGGAA